MEPIFSKHAEGLKPTPIRRYSMLASQRKDNVKVMNLAIGNVSLPMHPAMQERMFNLKKSSFSNGVDQYTETFGLAETKRAFLHVIESSGFSIEGLRPIVTSGGSQAMLVSIRCLCDPVYQGDRPLMLFDPAYPNYKTISKSLGVRTVSVQRILQEEGEWTLPDKSNIESLIRAEHPAAMLVIPYDNPTGQLLTRNKLVELAELCVKFNMWMISDEAYRELQYDGSKPVSIWGLGDVPGLKGRRVGIDTTSKVFNACGLRIGGLITDNEELHYKFVAEASSYLCADRLGQHIFGAIESITIADLQKWYSKQREYYKPLISGFRNELVKRLPGVIVSRPDASIYSVIDLRNLVDKNFSAEGFVEWCATSGYVEMGGEKMTFLAAPMAGFYSLKEGAVNLGRTQMRVAYVLSPEEMKFMPELFSRLFEKYIGKP